MRDVLKQPTDRPYDPWRSAIDWRAKGFPAVGAAIAADQIAELGWNLFDGRFLLPTMVIHEAALDHNIALIADFCARRGISLAPHGKATMAPAIFRRQLAAGAWAMTLATPWQARVAATVGVPRILIANEVTDPAGIDWMGTTLDGDGPEVYCWVDSAAGVALLDARLKSHQRRLPVLVEVGMPGGRAGARTLDAALEVAYRVSASSALRLAGVAFFEGVTQETTREGREAAVHAVMDLARAVVAVIEPLIAADGGTEIVLTGGGSQYLDIVVDGLVAPLGTDLPVRGVLRSGATVSHDHGGTDLVSPFGSVRAGHGPRLRPALEVWAPVLSLPEPGLAIVGAGRRDLPPDGAPPMVIALHRPGRGVERLGQAGGLEAVRLNDQHAYVRIAADRSLDVGDLVAFGVRHVCTAFDRWRWLAVVDDGYDVVDGIELLF
jgi:D-serine deaminase-like pyridoxal phosphate-dependent protein